MQTILIMSGKGGVGKTTVSIGIAKSLSKRYNVGIYDADLMCPNGPRLMGMPDDSRIGTGIDGGQFYPLEYDGLRVFSTGFMLPADAVMTLEGDRRSLLLKDISSRLEWGDIDYLIVDLPPGTGDENLAVIESMPNIEGVVMVVTGKHESLDDAGRVLAMLDDLPQNIPVIGVIRNMAYIECAGCGERIDLFDDRVDIEEELDNKVIGTLPYKNLIQGDFGEIADYIDEFCIVAAGEVEGDE